MTQKLDEFQLREIAWRRPLNPEERAQLENYLKKHPELRSEWESDLALATALSALTQHPAPSNLAARVLSEIDRSATTAKRPHVHRWHGLNGWLRWATGAAMAALILWGGLLWHQNRKMPSEAEALATLATVTEPTDLPSPEALENFEIIMRIHPEPLADMQLLALGEKLAEFNSKP